MSIPQNQDTLRADHIILQERVHLVCSQLEFLISLACELENLHHVKGDEFASMLEGLHQQLKSVN